MSTSIRITLLAGVMLLLCLSAPAQSVSIPVPAVSAKISGERVRFTAPSSVVQMRVEVVSESGISIFDSTSRGNFFDWAATSGTGDAPVDGVYACVITLKSLGGKISQRAGTIEFSGGRPSLRKERSPLTGAQEAVVGPIEEDSRIAVLSDDIPSATVVGHDGKAGQVTATTGDLTFRTGDVFAGTEKEQMRITADGKVGIGTDAPETPLDVKGIIRASDGYGFMNGSRLTTDEKGTLKVTRTNGTEAPMATGTGTLNRIPKWLETGGAGELGDSVIYEKTGGNGFIGINTDTPGTINGVTFNTVALHVNRTVTSGYIAVDSSGLNSYAGLILNRSSANANNRMWVIDNQPASGGVDSRLAFSTYADNGIPTARMAITRTGNVGIGTITPRALFEVRANATEMARFNGYQGSYITIANNDGDVGYFGILPGAQVLDLGTYNGHPANLRLTLQTVPKITIEPNLTTIATNTSIQGNLQLSGSFSYSGPFQLSGDASQPNSSNGLVKAAAAVVGGTIPTISRQFNKLSGSAITITRIGTGQYQIDFGADISGRFYSATLWGSTPAAVVGQLGLVQNNPTALTAIVTDSAGTPTDALSFNILVY